MLRAECDCEEHRTAGAGSRTVLTPGAVPAAEVVFDGAAELGWSGIEAGRLDVPTAAAMFDEMLAQLAPVPVAEPVLPVRTPARAPSRRPSGRGLDPWTNRQPPTLPVLNEPERPEVTGQGWSPVATGRSGR